MAIAIRRLRVKPAMTKEKESSPLGEIEGQTPAQSKKRVTHMAIAISRLGAGPQ